MVSRGCSDRVSKFTEQQNDLKARTTGALIYPAILAFAGTSIVTVLIVFFVPKFGEMFEQLRQQGNCLGHRFSFELSEQFKTMGCLYSWFPAIASAIYYQLQTERGMRLADLAKLRMPMFGVISKPWPWQDFVSVGTLLKNGVPILKSLDISRAAAGNRIYFRCRAAGSENITAGESLAKPLAKSSYFPKTVVDDLGCRGIKLSGFGLGGRRGRRRIGQVG